MNIYELETVCAVDTFKSFSHAALELNSTQATVSKHVVKVESEMGIRIFERASKSSPCKLTSDGETVIEYLHDIVNSYHMAMTQAWKLESKEKSINIGYVQHFGTLGEKAILSDFAISNPDVTIYCQTPTPRDRLGDMLVKGTVDAAFLLMIKGNSNFTETYTRQLSDPDVCIDAISSCCCLTIGMSKNHPFAKEKTITREMLSSLYTETFIFDSYLRSHYLVSNRRIGVIEQFFNFPSPMKIRHIDFADLSIVLDLVSRGDGLIVQCCPVPERMGDVVFVPVDGWNIPTHMCLAYLKSSHNPAILLLRKAAKSYSEKVHKD